MTTIGSINKFVAAYIDATSYPSFDMVKCAKATGQKFFTLGFIVDKNGEPTWGTYYNLSDNWFMDQIGPLREMGGDVIISSGGAANTESADAITDINKLVGAYQKVVDAYSLKMLDFDIEGASIAKKDSVDRSLGSTSDAVERRKSFADSRNVQAANAR